MKEVKIVDSPETIEETLEERYVRNMQECLSILNDLCKELKENKVDTTFRVHVTGTDEHFSILQAFSITLESAVKKTTINYVPQQDRSS